MNQILALLGFALVTAFTPGPNNTMVMASGANWGFMRSAPHVLGIGIGFPAMLLAEGFGLGAVFEAFPIVHVVLRYVAFAYLVFLAWKLARSGRPDAAGVRTGKPLTFFQAALFQWVNPKAWVMAVGALALFGEPSAVGAAPMLMLALIFVLAGWSSAATWRLFGTAIARFIDTGRRTAIFNGAMAILLVVSMLPSLL